MRYRLSEADARFVEGVKCFLKDNLILILRERLSTVSLWRNPSRMSGLERSIDRGGSAKLAG